MTVNDITPDATTLDVQSLGTAMIDAARATFGKRGPALQATAELELRRLARALADVEALLLRGEIDPERAKTLAGIHQLSVRSVFRSVEGLSLLAAEQTMQAVTGVAASVLNRIVGFKLL